MKKTLSILFAVLILCGAAVGQTGTGYVVYSNSPTISSPTISGATLTAPSLGVATATSLNGVTISTTAISTLPANAALTDGATITYAVTATGLGQRASVTLAGNRTLAFSGIAAGMSGDIYVTQDGTGSRTLATPSGTLVAGASMAGVLTLSTAANSVDKVHWDYDGTHYHMSVTLAYK